MRHTSGAMKNSGARRRQYDEGGTGVRVGVEVGVSPMIPRVRDRMMALRVHT
jgi:hypothetical protein